MAVANYHDTNDHLPLPFLRDEAGTPMHSWRIQILPFIEQDHVFKRYSFDEPWNGDNNRRLADSMAKILALHEEYQRELTTTNYLVCIGKQTAWQPGNYLTYSDLKDGSSNTIGIAENLGMKVHWMEPRDLEFDSMDFTFNSPHGVSSKYKNPAVGLLDGSVRQLPRTITPEALRAWFTIDGGEELNALGDQCEPLTDGRQRQVAKP